MEKPVFDLRLPEAWKAKRIFQFGQRPAIVVIAFSPRNFTFGVEIINGYAKGLALVIGPFWIGVAIH